MIEERGKKFRQKERKWTKGKKKEFEKDKSCKERERERENLDTKNLEEGKMMQNCSPLKI